MAKRYVLSESAAREIKRLLRGTGEVSRRQGATAELAFDSEYVAPYTVQWAQSANDGSGAWIIWLPSDDCLMVGGAPIDLTSALTEAGGEYPTGWYLLDEIAEDADSVYLNVHVPKEEESQGGDEPEPEAEGDDGEGGEGEEDEEAEITANFAASADEAEEGETVWAIEVAKLNAKNVIQVVRSILTLGGDGSLGDTRDCVTSLNEVIDDIDIIGGSGIRVETIGQTIKISFDEDKTDSDPDPNNPEKDPCCPHPGNGGEGGSSGDGNGGGGVDMNNADSEDAGGGCAGCGEGSTSGGSSATGQPEPGASGKPASGGEGKPNGGQNPSAPSAGPASSGASGSAQGSGGTAGGKPASPGMFNGSTTPVSGRLGEKSTTPIYGGTHSQLSSSNTMNTSPFAQAGNYKPIGSGATTLYGGTHSQIANGKTLNESPFKSRR